MAKFKVNVDVRWLLDIIIEIDDELVPKDEGELQRLLEDEAEDYDNWSWALQSAGPPSDVEVDDWKEVEEAPHA